LNKQTSRFGFLFLILRGSLKWIISVYSCWNSWYNWSERILHVNFRQSSVLKTMSQGYFTNAAHSEKGNFYIKSRPTFLICMSTVSMANVKSKELLNRRGWRFFSMSICYQRFECKIRRVVTVVKFFICDGWCIMILKPTL
jgi:hypothetical protein